MKFMNLKDRIIYYCVMILISILAISYGFINKNDYLNGFGFGLLTVSIIFLIKQIIILKNPKKLKEQKTRENDERNIMIITYSYAFTFRIGILLEALATIISSFIGNILISEVIASVICIQLIIYIIGLYIFSKKN